MQLIQGYKDIIFNMSYISITHIRIKGLLIFIFLFIGMLRLEAQHVAFCNNLVYDASLTPNLGFDLKIDSAWTVGLSAGLRPWPTDDAKTRKYRHLSLMATARKWTAGTPWKGAFYGFDALYMHYNLADLKLLYFGMFGDARHHRIQGNLYGLGGKGGYAWDLGSGFGIELMGGLDLSYTHYRMYECVKCGTLLQKRNKVYLLPTAAVNVNYHF